MSEDIVSVLSFNPAINYISPDLSSIASYFSEVLQHSLNRQLRMLLVLCRDAQRHG